MGKRFKAEEIVMKLRESEILLGKGMDVVSACRQIGISEQSYYRWKKEYGGETPGDRMAEAEIYICIGAKNMPGCWTSQINTTV